VGLLALESIRGPLPPVGTPGGLGMLLDMTRWQGLKRVGKLVAPVLTWH
jgi:hypothetical protein